MTRKRSSGHFGPLGGFAAAGLGLGDEEAIFVAEVAGEEVIGLSELREALLESCLSGWTEVSEFFRQFEVFHNAQMLVHEAGSFNPCLGSRSSSIASSWSWRFPMKK